MKKNILLLIIALYVIGLLIFISYYSQYFEQSLTNIFYASMGLLTFTSIFYSFTISSGSELLKKAVTHYEGQKTGIKDKLKKIAASKDNKDLSKKLDALSSEALQIDTLIDYLNLNKWIFICIVSYMMSIAMFLVKGAKYAAAIQIGSFWIGFLITLIIATVWFMANFIGKETKAS